MLYNIKDVYLHCVFHGIRFKVNEDWVSVIDTLLFFVSIPFIFLLHEQKKNETKRKFAVCIFLPTPILFPLNKKNSLRSNSFLFFTFQKAFPLYGKKKRPESSGVDVYILTSLHYLSSPLENPAFSGGA